MSDKLTGYRPKQDELDYIFEQLSATSAAQVGLSENQRFCLLEVLYTCANNDQLQRPEVPEKPEHVFDVWSELDAKGLITGSVGPCRLTPNIAAIRRLFEEK